MDRRILWINTAMTEQFDGPISQSLRDVAQPGTVLDVASLPGEGPVHLEYSAYQTLVARPIAETVLWADDEGYDATVIGCFYDPFVRAAKELATRTAITAPAEASIRLAQSLGERFSIVVGREMWIPQMEANVRAYGAERNFASFRAVGMGVLDFQRDRDETEKRIREQAERAVSDDRADVVILGCTIEYGFYRSLQESLGVPVVDATIAPLRFAEMLADVNRAQGWRQSPRLGYETPPVSERTALLNAREPNLLRDPRS